MPFHILALIIGGAIVLGGLTIWAATTVGGLPVLMLLTPVTLIAAIAIRRKRKQRRHDPAR